MEKTELELFQKGEFDTSGDVSEDTSVVPEAKPEEGAPAAAPAHSGKEYFSTLLDGEI